MNVYTILKIEKNNFQYYVCPSLIANKNPNSFSLQISLDDSLSNIDEISIRNVYSCCSKIK